VINGPAIIEEVTTTIVVEPKWSARLDGSGSYVMTRNRARPTRRGRVRR
jgi:N-methylhydantoinase A